MKYHQNHLEEEEIVCGSNSNDVLLQIDEIFILNLIKYWRSVLI